jgi:arabinogalactan oligomer/maltooligosaccharide transport system permease protein
MSAAQAQAGQTITPTPPPRSSSSPLGLIVRLLVVGLVDAVALWLAVNIWGDGNIFLALTLAVVALGITLINLRPELWPLRWMSPGLAAIVLLAIYPIFYTVYVAFTNYGTGHRFTKIEAVEQMGKTTFLPETSTSYAWSAFQNEAGDYALWLTDSEGNTFFATPGEPLRPITASETGSPLNDDGIPTTLEGYTLLERADLIRAFPDLQGIIFGDETNPVGIRSRTQAGAFQQKWVYDPAQDAIIDQETNTVFVANDTIGQFVAANGTTAPLGYWVTIGFDNFTRVFRDVGVSGPLLRVFLWTVAFALLSVLTSFALGLFMALLLNNFMGARFIKSLLIIPYAIPGMISILIWRGMLNENVGVISRTMDGVLGWSPPWSTDPGWAKFAVLLVNLWLSFPYFMLICSGALQSIPSSIYEAAEVDGANVWDKFWNLTLPLLMVAIGPLLIASFTFNFNNYLLIEGLWQGGPPMVGTAAPPVGHTDILVNYTYRFAFAAGGRQDFGFASAIAIIIFLFVGVVTLFQFRFTKRLEEIGEGV